MRVLRLTIGRSLTCNSKSIPFFGFELSVIIKEMLMTVWSNAKAERKKSKDDHDYSHFRPRRQEFSILFIIATSIINRTAIDHTVILTATKRIPNGNQ